MSTFFTDKPLVVFGATGLLSSDFIFMSCVERFSPILVLHGSNMQRLQGLKDELDESGFEGLEVRITTDLEEACRYGGYALYARSVRADKQTREEMLLDNAPMAKEVGQIIRRQHAPFERIVCVANPSDLIGLTLLVHSGLPETSVMSLSGLDTLRFRRALKRRLDVTDDRLDRVWTLGSHDQSMAVMVDTVRVDGQPLSRVGLTPDDIREIEDEVRTSGINIYKLRGHTSYQSPAVVSLRMMMATDANPFLYPTARYHHSDRYPFSYGSLPSVIDSKGCHHESLTLCATDLERLDSAFGSIICQRDTLIDRGILPPTEEWSSSLHEEGNVVTLQC